MGDQKTYLIHQIVKYSNKLDEKGFTANHDGNLSAKFEDMLLATPTAVSKGNMVPEMVITLDINGKKIAGVGKPFSEIKLHLAAFAARTDAKVVMHAHPPFATARGLVNQPLTPNLPEAIVSIGNNIPVIDFTMPGSAENDSLIKNAFMQTDIFMMAGNGVLAIGDDVEQAFLRIELVEHLCKIEFYANQMGTPMKLSEENIQTLLEKRIKANLGPQARCQSTNRPKPANNLKELIAKEIKKVLQE